jgi:hypothetical protein
VCVRAIVRLEAAPARMDELPNVSVSLPARAYNLAGLRRQNTPGAG